MKNLNPGIQNTVQLILMIFISPFTQISWGQPHNGITTEVQRLIIFLSQFAENCAIYLPSHIPGYKNCDIQLLHSSTTKKIYQESAEISFFRPLGYSPFTRLWKMYKPQITVMKPMSDLCWICEKHSVALVISMNRPQEEKSEVYDLHTCIMSKIISEGKERQVLLCAEEKREEERMWDQVLDIVGRI